MTQPTDKRALRREETHRRIYETALELFEAHGYDAVTVNQIAEAAGVTVQTFYAHYRSKDRLLMALPTVEQVRALFDALPSGLSVGDRVRAGLTAFVREVPPEVMADILRRWTIIAGTPGLRNRAAESERATVALILEAMSADGSAGGASRLSTEVTVNALMAAYTQSLLRWAEKGGDRPLEDVVVEVQQDLGQI